MTGALSCALTEQTTGQLQLGEPGHAPPGAHGKAGERELGMLYSSAPHKGDRADGFVFRNGPQGLGHKGILQELLNELETRPLSF